MKNSEKAKMNIPNRLTVLRLILVPIFMVIMMIPASLVSSVITSIVGVFLFIVASVTDMLDGKIARKYNLVTNFGKFLDPIADKFMVIGAYMVILYRVEYATVRPLLIWALIIVIFRELAVTSIRLIAVSEGGVVIAANILGKIKTVTQIVSVCTVIIEPLLYKLPFLSFIPKAITDAVPLSFATIAVMAFFTLWSGINYIKGAWKYVKQ